MQVTGCRIVLETLVCLAFASSGVVHPQHSSAALRLHSAALRLVTRPCRPRLLAWDQFASGHPSKIKSPPAAVTEACNPSPSRITVYFMLRYNEQAENRMERVETTWWHRDEDSQRFQLTNIFLMDPQEVVVCGSFEDWWVFSWIPVSFPVSYFPPRRFLFIYFLFPRSLKFVDLLPLDCSQT